MYAGRPRGNGEHVARLRSQHLARGRHELRKHERGGGGRGRLEMLARGGERPLERRGKGERRDPGSERLETTMVAVTGHRQRGEQAFRGPHDQPEGE